jgi:5-formyltetrahydrofolate cyclo-ligase
MKTKIRARALKARNSLSRRAIESRSRSIARRLFALPEYRRARTVMFYLSHGSEVSTRAMIRAALSGGRRVALPVTRARGRRLVPVLISGPEDVFTTGEEGIPEPILQAARTVSVREIDLIVLPGLAFDARGNRVGRGKAYYDIFLKEAPAATARVALAFEQQVVEEIPSAPHDAPVGLVLTEKRAIRCSRFGRDGDNGGKTR